MFGNVAQNNIREPHDVLDQARDFIDQFFKSVDDAGSAQHVRRMGQIEKDIMETGTYHLTEQELLFGGKIAWRNAARCIGRIQWNKLQVCRLKFILCNCYII